MFKFPFLRRSKVAHPISALELAGNGLPELNLLSHAELAYTASMVLAGVFGFVKLFVYAHLLETTWFGLYGLGVLLSSLGITFCQFGVFRGLDSLLPTLYGADRTAEARAVRNASAGLVLLFAVLLIAGAMIFAVTAKSISLPTRSVLVAAAFVASSNALLGLGIQDQRSRGRTLAFGIVVLAKSVLNLILGALSAHWFACTGILVAESLVALLLFLVVIRADCPGFRFAYPDAAILQRPFRTGMPLLLKTLLNDLALSLDRWCIPAAVGLAAFGQYNFGLLPVTAAMLVHNMIWSSVGPKSAHDYGRFGDASRVLSTIHRWATWLVIASVVAWLPMQLLASFVVPQLFPKYVDGAHLLTILYWGAVFQVLSLYDWVPMVLQRTKPLMYVTVASLAVTGSLLLTAVVLRWQLPAYALIFVAGRGTASVGQFVLALWMVKIDSGDQRRDAVAERPIAA